MGKSKSAQSAALLSPFGLPFARTRTLHWPVRAAAPDPTGSPPGHRRRIGQYVDISRRPRRGVHLCLRIHGSRGLWTGIRAPRKSLSQILVLRSPYHSLHSDPESRSTAAIMQDHDQPRSAFERDFMEEFTNENEYRSEAPPPTADAIDDATDYEYHRSETPPRPAITPDEVANDADRRSEALPLAAIASDPAQDPILPKHFVAIASSLPWICSMSMLSARDRTKAQRFLVGALNERKVKEDWSVDRIPAKFRRGLDQLFGQFTSSPVACESVLTFIVEKLLRSLEADGEPISIEDHEGSALFKARLDGLTSLDDARSMIMEQLGNHLQIQDAMRARAAALATINTNIQEGMSARAGASAAISCSPTGQSLQKQLGAAQAQIEELRKQKEDVEKLVRSLGSDSGIETLRQEKDAAEKLANGFCERNLQLETAVLALHNYQIDMAQALQVAPNPLTMFDPYAEIYFPGVPFLSTIQQGVAQPSGVDPGEVQLDALLPYNAQHVSAPQGDFQQRNVPQRDLDQGDMLLDALLQYDAHAEFDQLESPPQKPLQRVAVQQPTPPQEAQQQEGAQQLRVPQQSVLQQVAEQNTQGPQRQGDWQSASRSQAFQGQGFQQKGTFLGFHVPQEDIQIMSPPQLGQYIQQEAVAQQQVSAPQDCSQQDPFQSYNMPRKNTQQMFPQPNQNTGGGFSDHPVPGDAHTSQASRGFDGQQLANPSAQTPAPHAHAAPRTPAATPRRSPPSSKKRKAELLEQRKTDYFLCTMETKKHSGVTCNGINYTYRSKGQELIEREKCCKCARNTWAQHKIYVSEDWVCGMGGVTPSSRSASRKGSAGSAAGSAVAGTPRPAMVTPTRPAKSHKLFAGSSAVGSWVAGSSVAGSSVAGSSVAGPSAAAPPIPGIPRECMMADAPVAVQQALQSQAPPPPARQQEEGGPARVYKPNHTIRGAAAGTLALPSIA
ncbi:hypothetical protein JHW43_003177 [Diplocarpon mali]|nr:hypothetical protein JHW43_003177 [Diplocarpon mali]